MSEILQLIKETIEVIEKTCSANLIIYDIYGTFSNMEIKDLPQYNRWPSTTYCLMAKNNSHLYNKCKFLKNRLLQKNNYSDSISKSTCFLGVTEYNIPIKFNAKYIGLISITGFKGEIKSKYSDMYADLLGYNPKDFYELREIQLASIKNEKYIKTMLKVLAYLFDECIKQNSVLIKKSPTTNPYMLKALEYIRVNHNKNISVSQVAKECYISVPYLQSLFSYYLGHGVAEEIRDRQINYAKELLSGTQYSVKHISYLCGFKSPDYFCTVFKRVTNMSPLKYRKINYVSK